MERVPVSVAQGQGTTLSSDMEGSAYSATGVGCARDAEVAVGVQGSTGSERDTLPVFGLDCHILGLGDPLLHGGDL
jgi:hypothetical protein